MGRGKLVHVVDFAVGRTVSMERIAVPGGIAFFNVANWRRDRRSFPSVGRFWGNIRGDLSLFGSWGWGGRGLSGNRSRSWRATGDGTFAGATRGQQANHNEQNTYRKPRRIHGLGSWEDCSRAATRASNFLAASAIFSET